MINAHRAVVAQWIRPWTLNREVPGSNLLAAAVVPLGKALYQSCQPLRKNRICYEIWKGIRKYESASKKYDFSVIRNRMLPPFISDRKSKHPTFILA